MKNVLASVINRVLSRMRRRRDYQRAYWRWLIKRPFDLSGPSEKYPTREEIYDRYRNR
jgi:hypothetical protein